MTTMLGITIPWKIAERQDLSESDKLVYGAIALAARKLQLARRTPQKLGETVALSGATVRASTKKLTEAGLVKKADPTALKAKVAGRGMLVPHAIAQHPNLTPSAKLVYGLLEFRTRIGTAFEQRKLAETIGMPVRTFRDGLRSLERFHLVEVEPEAGKKSRYRLLNKDLIATTSEALGDPKARKRAQVLTSFGKAFYESGDDGGDSTSATPEPATSKRFGKALYEGDDEEPVTSKPEPTPEAITEALAADDQVGALRKLDVTDERIEELLLEQEWQEVKAEQVQRSRALLEILVEALARECHKNRPDLTYEIGEGIEAGFHEVLCRHLGEQWSRQRWPNNEAILVDKHVRSDLDTYVFEKVFRPAIAAWEAAHPEG